MSGINRVVVVTGGVQGIGRRTAELLAQQDYRLAIVDLHHPTETVRSIQAKGREVIVYGGDITDEATMDRFSREVLDRYERIDVLVNNAGVSLIAAAKDTTLSDYRRVLEVNLVAPPSVPT